VWSRSLAIPAQLLLCSALILALWGLLTVFNTSAAEIVDRLEDRPLYGAVLKQAIFALMGLGCGIVSYRYGYGSFIKNPTLLWIATCVLLMACFVPGLGQSANGACRWIKLAGLSAQPSELAKLTVPLCAIAWLITAEPPRLKQFLKRMAQLCLPIALVVAEPDNGTALILSCEVGLILLLSRICLKYWVLPMGVLAAISGVAALSMPHVQRRIDVFLNPMSDLLGKGHQAYQAAIAVGSGGLTGKGWGRGLQKLAYLPEAQNDYVAAIVAEECGFIGMMILLGLYGLILISGYRIAMKQDEPKLVLVLCYTTLICGQATLNLSVVTGLLPSTGIPLPLLSQGGTSLLCNLVAVGWILSHAKEAVRDQTKAHKELHLKRWPSILNRDHA